MEQTTPLPRAPRQSPVSVSSRGNLIAIQANNMAFEGFINELDCIDNVETGLSEGADGACG
jgi:hypothetical protein